ncbi:hypothetical protein F2Q70_00021092 [Brassica cretica]|uniref:Uncharacterized protein n=1 Tax=Brassica cretica TaxID=69181 RepID=A0A8S9GY28_BRACR|nr:hypothetical protein F2Q70_00021092 [Brassica cretica]
MGKSPLERRVLDSPVEHIIDPSCEDVKGNKNPFSNQISDPIFNLIGKDKPEILGAERETDAGVFYDNPIYYEDTTMPSQQTDFGYALFLHEAFGKSDGATKNFDLKDTTPPLQTMSETSGQRHNYFGLKNCSTKEDSSEPKPERVVLEVKDKNTYADAMKQYVNCGVWRKDFHRESIRKPPDPHRSTIREYADLSMRQNLPSNSGSERAEEDIDLLTTKGNNWKLMAISRVKSSISEVTGQIENNQKARDQSCNYTEGLNRTDERLGLI